MVDGVQYGVTRGNFLGRWWDFYERGRSFADGGFYKEAEADLTQAVSVRSKDNRRSRTYGLHFIPYFGSRELGVVLYRQGRMKEAIRYLGESLTHDPSEKAEYYLSQCLRHSSKHINDREKPTIHLNPLPELTNHSSITITGEVVDNLHIDSVVVNSKKISPVLKKNQLTFFHEIDLDPGANPIEIIAYDISGNSSYLQDTLYVDRDPPIISVEKVSPEKIVLSVVDKNKAYLIEDKVKNVDIVKRAASTKFEFIPIDASYPVYLEFEDAANNRNGIKIAPEYLQLGRFLPKMQSKGIGDKPILLASKSGLQGILPARAKQSANKLSSSALAAPVLEVERLDTVNKVFQKDIIVSGRIYGEFENFTINDEEKIAKGRDVRFSFKKSLQLNEHNRITLKLLNPLDASLDKITRTYTITRLPQPVEQRDLRASVILCPLAQEGGIGDVRSDQYNNLTHALYRNGRFQIIPHQKEVVDRLSEELKLVSEGWINTSRAAKLGRRLKADYTITAIMRPTVNDIEIFGKLIDTNTGKILAYCDAYELTKDADDFESIYERFAGKFVQEFPIVERQINKARQNQAGLIHSIFSRTNNDLVTIDLGHDANVKQGMKFLAYHRGTPLRDSETDEIIVDGRIVFDGKLIAETVKKRFTHLNPYEGNNFLKAKYVVSQ